MGGRKKGKKGGMEGGREEMMKKAPRKKSGRIKGRGGREREKNSKKDTVINIHNKKNLSLPPSLFPSFPTWTLLRRGAESWTGARERGRDTAAAVAPTKGSPRTPTLAGLGPGGRNGGRPRARPCGGRTRGRLAREGGRERGREGGRGKFGCTFSGKG